MGKRTRPRLLDLYCSAGGASMGYFMAGFDVVGVDVEPQPNYPFEFIQASALDVELSGFDAYAASPPCQGYSRLRHRTGGTYPMLIEPTRDRLAATGRPYVIENVEDARPCMIDPIMICGSGCALRVRRHRLFESNVDVVGIDCDHGWQDAHRPYKIIMSSYRKSDKYRESGIIPVYGNNQLLGGKEHYYKSLALGIDWMTSPELNQAIPPRYTDHIGRQLITHV